MIVSACSSSGAGKGGSGTDSGGASGGGTETSIKVGYVQSLVMAGVHSIPKYINGVKVKLVPFASGVDEMNALNAGSLQFAAPSWQQFVAGLAQGDDWVAVAGVARGGLEIIASNKIVPANEIDKASSSYTGSDAAKLLIGRKIGVLPATFPYYALEAWLSANGVDPSQVHLVNAPSFGDLNTALGNGGIDAASSLDPYPMQPRAQGTAVLLAFPYPQGRENYLQLSSAIVATGSYVKQHPNVAQQVVSALQKASTTLTANPSQWVNETLEYTDFPKSQIELSLNPASQGKKDTSKFVNNFLDTRMYSSGLNKWVTLLHRLGGMPKTITADEINSHLDYSFLEKATGKSKANLGYGK